MNTLVKTTLVGLLLVPTVGFGVEWTVHGTLKNETAYFVSGEKRLDKVQNRLDLIPEVRLTDQWEFRGRILSWYDAAMDIEASNATDLTPAIQKYYRTYREIKEAYLLYGADDYDLRLGKQQVVWGKTDGLRLLDIVNPLDMREFMLDDFLDSRVGVVAARLNYYAYLGDSEHEFEFLIIPDAKVATFAPTGSRWSYTIPTPPAGIKPVIHSANEPSWSIANTEFGTAWRSNLDGWDVSLNWFYGWKDTPVLKKNLVGTNMDITPSYMKMHTVGGSFSNAFGATVLRGEVAVNINEKMNGNGVTLATSVTEHTTWNVALGLDYNKNNWRISPQLFIRYLPTWDATVAEDKSSGFISLMISTDYLNDKLKSEVIALLNWADGSWMLRPKVSYEFTDQVSAKIGLDVFAGNKTGFFGQFDDNDRVYTEVEYTF